MTDLAEREKLPCLFPERSIITFINDWKLLMLGLRYYSTIILLCFYFLLPISQAFFLNAEIKKSLINTVLLNYIKTMSSHSIIKMYNKV